MLVCAHCWEWGTFSSMWAHVYMVTKRGRPLSDKKFCSMECLETHLAATYPEWEAVGEQWSLEAGRRCVHEVSIAEKKKVRERIKYSDAHE